MSRLDTRWKNTVWSRRNSGCGAVRLWLTTSQKILHIGQHLRKSCPRNSVDAYCCSVLLSAAGCCWVLMSALTVWCKAFACLPQAKLYSCALPKAFGAPVNCRGCWRALGHRVGLRPWVSRQGPVTRTHTQTQAQAANGPKKPKTSRLGLGSQSNTPKNSSSTVLTSTHLINPIQEGCFS